MQCDASLKQHALRRDIHTCRGDVHDAGARNAGRFSDEEKVGKANSEVERRDRVYV